jgi:glutamate dehydrogenase
VIVPVGSKGGFVVKRPPAAALGRDALRAEGIACYQIFVSSLLDLTDNRRHAAPDAQHGNFRHCEPAPPATGSCRPALTVCHDGTDPYLVVAADKGTATFSVTSPTSSRKRAASGWTTPSPRVARAATTTS